MVACSEFEEIDVSKFVVLYFFEDVYHVVNLVNGKAASFVVGSFPAALRPTECLRGEVVLFRNLADGLAFMLVERKAQFVVYKVHVDNAVDGRAFLADRAFDGGYFGSALGDVKYADVFFRDAEVDVFLPDIGGSDVHCLLQPDDVRDEGREAHLYQPDDCRAEIGDEGTLFRVLCHVAFGAFEKQPCGFVDLDNVIESEVVQFGKYLFLCDVLAELPDEDSRQEDDPERETEDFGKIVLRYDDSMLRAGLQAHAAVGTGGFVDDRFAVLDADGRGRAHMHAVRAAGACCGDHFQGMVERILFHPCAIVNGLSW